MAGKRLKRKSRRHIDPEKLAAFVNEKTPKKDQGAIITHLAGCAHCRRLVSKVVLSKGEVEDPGSDRA